MRLHQQDTSSQRKRFGILGLVAGCRTGCIGISLVWNQPERLQAVRQRSLHVADLE